MAEVSATPITVSHRDEGYLAAGISASATSITVGAIYKYPSGVKTKQGFDSTQGYAEISLGGRTEIISFGAASVNATTKVTTLTDVRRGLSQTSTTQSLTAGTGIAFPKGAKIRVIDSANYIHATAFKDKPNTFTEDQTLESGNKFLIGGANAYVWTENSGTDMKFKDANNSEKTLSQLAAAGGSDEKVAISANDTTPDYLVNKVTGGDGITVTETGDGGDETLDIDLDIPVLVASGGTGVTSTTAYAPLFGGTTSTGALQSGTVGTANQVMTSNGAGALPTFQDIKSFVEPVFSSTTSSTPLSNPTSATAFGTHTYTIPANDLINGVRYDFEFAAFAVHGVNSTFRLGVGLGASQDISVLFPTTTSADEYCMVRGSIIGEAAAGASANVHIRLTGFTDESDTTTPTRYVDVSKATNGTLAITFFGTFGTSDGGNAVTGLDSFITRRSTTAA